MYTLDRRGSVFQRRHYQRIADCLKQSRPYIGDPSNGPSEALSQWQHSVDCFVTMFQLDNANFDRERFLTWCYRV